MTTQSEAGSDVSPARKCVMCRGAGTVAMRSLDCLHSGGNCPCDTEDFPCPRCGGAMVELCCSCSAPAVVTDADGDWCAACAAAPAPCSICEMIDAAEAERRAA